MLGEWRPDTRRSHKEEMILARLCVGHTRLTHNYILAQEPQPKCTTCQTPYTMKHILIECNELNQMRQRLNRARHIKDVFDNYDIQDIMSLLREVGLQNKI